VAAKTYKLISEHPSADEWLAEAASTLSDHAIDAKRPLNYVAIHTSKYIATDSSHWEPRDLLLNRPRTVKLR